MYWTAVQLLVYIYTPIFNEHLFWGLLEMEIGVRTTIRLEVIKYLLGKCPLHQHRQGNFIKIYISSKSKGTGTYTEKQKQTALVSISSQM